MKHRILRGARAEVREAKAYYQKQRSGLGNEFYGELREEIARVLAAPTRNAFVMRPYRKRLFKRFPYGVVYRMHEDEIVIVAIAHNSRDSGYWLERAEADE